MGTLTENNSVGILLCHTSRPALTYGRHVWSKAIIEKSIVSSLVRVNRLGVMIMGNFRIKTPTAGLEVIWYVPPLPLLIESKSAMKFRRIQCHLRLKDSVLKTTTLSKRGQWFLCWGYHWSWGWRKRRRTKSWPLWSGFAASSWRKMRSGREVASRGRYCPIGHRPLLQKLWRGWRDLPPCHSRMPHLWGHSTESPWHSSSPRYAPLVDRDCWVPFGNEFQLSARWRSRVMLVTWVFIPKGESIRVWKWTGRVQFLALLRLWMLPPQNYNNNNNKNMSTKRVQ